MNTMLPKWLIEQEENSKVLDSLPTLRDLRRHYQTLFLQKGLPTIREERFKYTNVNFLLNQHFSRALRLNEESIQHAICDYRLANSVLLVFVNGYFMPQLSDLHQLPEEVVIASLSNIPKDYLNLIENYWPDHADKMKYQHHIFATLNAANFMDGLFCFVPEECEILNPIHLLSITSGKDAFYTYPNHLIVLEKNSKLTLLEEYVALDEIDYLMNVLMTVTVEDGAIFNHYKIQTEHKNAIHMEHTFIQQKQNSKVSMMHFAKGASFARDDIIIDLQEVGASCSTCGYYELNQDDQYIDHHIDIQHSAQLTQSEMLYKGILNKKSRAVFNGRVKVMQHAQKILAHQENHNLLLSKFAEVYSKPDLEIYADDVKCKHGATIGELNQEALFYLRTRGIDKQKAVEILLEGFSEEIRQRISHQEIRQHIEEKCLC